MLQHDLFLIVYAHLFADGLSYLAFAVITFTEFGVIYTKLVGAAQNQITLLPAVYA